MNNILELCKIFHCKINDLVHTNMDDFNSLDNDIIMKVVKFNEEEQKKIKVLSKILFVMGRIGKIVTRVGIIFIVIIMFYLSLLLCSFDFKDDNYVSKLNFVKVSEKNDNTITFSLNNNNKIIIGELEKEDVRLINEVFHSYSLPILILLVDGGLLFIVVCFFLASKLLSHLEKLFLNIYDGETPFTLENIRHIKCMVHLMISCIITSTIGTSLFEIPFESSVTLDVDLFSIIEIIFLYAIAYVFEYGYKIQKDSKGVMYS